MASRYFPIFQPSLFRSSFPVSRGSVQRGPKGANGQKSEEKKQNELFFSFFLSPNNEIGVLPGEIGRSLTLAGSGPVTRGPVNQ